MFPNGFAMNGGYEVAQLGARMHYAVPRILCAANKLHRFYTDICAVKGWPRLLKLVPSSMLPPGARRLLGRTPANVPSQRITAFTAFGWEYHRRLRLASGAVRLAETHLWAGKEFCRRVIAASDSSKAGLYCYNTAGLELLDRGKALGTATVVEQTIAPRAVEEALLQTECARFPGWEARPVQSGAISELIERERAEWIAAGQIICGSEFVRGGIAECGGPAEKCTIVPYGIDLPAKGPCRSPRIRGAKLRVLTVGTVCLRKGVPYVLEAAKRLSKVAEFRIVGPIQVSPTAVMQLRQHVNLMGPVPRHELEAHYRWADLFLLPSVCEGSATVCYEAIARGLPVICTPNTGSVIEDGVHGYIVPACRGEDIADRVEVLWRTPELLDRLGANAYEHASLYTLERYAERLLHALDVKDSVDLVHI